MLPRERLPLGIWPMLVPFGTIIAMEAFIFQIKVWNDHCHGNFYFLCFSRPIINVSDTFFLLHRNLTKEIIVQIIYCVFTISFKRLKNQKSRSHCPNRPKLRSNVVVSVKLGIHFQMLNQLLFYLLLCHRNTQYYIATALYENSSCNIFDARSTRIVGIRDRIPIYFDIRVSDNVTQSLSHRSC